MMMEELGRYIGSDLSIGFKGIQSVGGGDSSQAFVVFGDEKYVFLKVGNIETHLELFECEQKALEHLTLTDISVPLVLKVGTWQRVAYIAMEHISSGKVNKIGWGNLGRLVAQLHAHTSSTYGLKYDNFIGPLHQENCLHDDWASFYIKWRLLPQFRLAFDAGWLSLNDIPSESRLENIIRPLLKDVKPSLLHGDLWSGNFLINKKDEAFLIDPSIYFGHSEVDLAMTKLFGGFDPLFYQAYHEIHPKDSGNAAREKIYQLYYLLVHLNLFGQNYYMQVKSILQRWL